MMTKEWREELTVDTITILIWCSKPVWYVGISIPTQQSEHGHAPTTQEVKSLTQSHGSDAQHLARLYLVSKFDCVRIARPETASDVMRRHRA